MSEEIKKSDKLEDKQKCKCGCEENIDLENIDLEENDDIVELVDDEGNAIKFFHVATVDYENNWYVFFTPTETVEGVNNDEVVIFRLDADEEGKDVFSPIEDEELLQKVYEEYVKIMDEDEDEEEDKEDKPSGCDGCSGCKR